MSDTLHIATDHRGVCTLLLNRPERHNALNSELIATLIQTLNQINHDEAIRAVVVTGAGASFCSGADLEWMRASVHFDEHQNRMDAEKLAELLRTLAELKKPTIAWVNGAAYGGGIGLIACCDIAIAHDNVNFAFSEVRLGLIPAVISPYIVAAIGLRQTKRLFLTAEPFSSRTAQALGLVHTVVTPEAATALLEQQLQQLLKGGPLAMVECKKLLQRFNHLPMDSELATLIAYLRASPEGQEGLAAFLEKRSPTWQG
ncbi:MAG: methylglutaconyl-CoA hydratase [Halothiobacillaceae bacterium]|nr:MAG: methylglutaconyl-CoA hydratase [Halothiobacillaceae bacterium]